MRNLRQYASDDNNMKVVIKVIIITIYGYKNATKQQVKGYTPWISYYHHLGETS